MPTGAQEPLTPILYSPCRTETMEALLRDILAALRLKGTALDARELENIIRQHNQRITRNEDHFAKKKIMPFYLRVKENHPGQWESWGIGPELEDLLMRTIRVKPQRTASGVATITVITKPHACCGHCIFCPNDVRMPKSYLANEPACQRAERNYFDPYLQVASRLRALKHMGHVTDKIELIILGGTWTDYARAYQIWFVEQLFEALNDSEDLRERKAAERRSAYKRAGIAHEEGELKAQTAEAQREVYEGNLTYNRAIERLYGKESAWERVANMQHASIETLEEQHRINEQARSRVVGLVMETRPDAITCENLSLVRRLGATKIQIGVQSLDEHILAENGRALHVADIERAFTLLRLYGFKIHAHFMANLLGATPESDAKGYRDFVTLPAYQPDEIKMYPCALIDGTMLCRHYRTGAWQPYDAETLTNLLVQNTLVTPPFVRVSRMIRDFSADDIIAGNKRVNLRQDVECAARNNATQHIQEIRLREIRLTDADLDSLTLDVVPYETTATSERFLQWVTPSGGIAGFLRLSLPKQECIDRLQEDEHFPLHGKEAMIREVHVYGKVAALGAAGGSAQHLGLGKKLIARACRIAREAGFERINVISSVGTRAYYRSLGFEDAGLYQQKQLL